MEKKIKNFILIDILILIFLFLASSTDLIIKERKQEKRYLSVLLEMPARGQQADFRAGIMEAASAYPTELHIINLTAWENAEDKYAILEKELENGCQGFILHCRSVYQMDGLLERIPAQIPVILYDSCAESARIYGKVNSDLQEESRLLTEGILQDAHKASGIILVSPPSPGYRVTELHRQVQRQLEAAGIPVSEVTLQNPSEVHTLAAGLSAWSSRILVSADVSVFQALGEENAKLGNLFSIYGAGFNSEICNYLEEGAVTGLVLHRAYEAGYFAMEKLTDALEKKPLREPLTIVESAFVTAENMYEPGIESILFPYV